VTGKNSNENIEPACKRKFPQPKSSPKYRQIFIGEILGPRKKGGHLHYKGHEWGGDGS